MQCEKFKELMMGYLDDEIEVADKQAFEEHLRRCKACSAELEEFRKLKEVTESMELAQPEDRLWQDYWSGIYNRVERSFGWIVLSIGAVILLAYGGFKVVETLIKDPNVGIVLKVGILSSIVGVSILLVSILRERLYFRKRDRYRLVRR